MLVSLILPCLNESEAIPPFMIKLSHARDYLLNAGYSLEVILVNDGSTDGSIALAKKFYPEIQVVSHDKNLGYGKALKTGFSLARGQFLAMMDIDDTYNPNDLAQLLDLLRSERADLVLGFRSENSEGFNSWRLFGNRMLRFFSRVLLFKLDLDVCSGIRVMTHDFGISLLNLEQGGFSFAIAMIEHCYRQGKNVKQVPIKYFVRRGSSKLNSIREGFSHIFLIFRFWLGRSLRG
jgi:glycosyltransferase involved in cell wall biosynthesis